MILTEKQEAPTRTPIEVSKKRAFAAGKARVSIAVHILFEAQRVAAQVVTFDRRFAKRAGVRLL